MGALCRDPSRKDRESKWGRKGHGRNDRSPCGSANPAVGCDFKIGVPQSDIADPSMLHSDLFPELDCHGVLLLAERTPRLRVLRCFLCETEITYTPDCDWVKVVYPGMRSELEE